MENQPVVEKPGNLKKTQMQLIAREIHFSETTVIFPSKDKETEAKVRIFTPAKEIPFAGHPVLGTAFVILSNKKGKKPSGKGKSENYVWSAVILPGPAGHPFSIKGFGEPAYGIVAVL